MVCKACFRGGWLAGLGLASSVWAATPAAGLPPSADDARAPTQAAWRPAEWSGELRALWQAPQANPAGPLAQAHALQASLGPPQADSASTEAELRARWRYASANLMVRHDHPAGEAPSHSSAQFNELHTSADLGAWQLSAGKKIISWDVGYAFRPNDLVQQEVRRSLLTTTLEGRPVLQAEYFEAERATSWVWVQPTHLQHAEDAQRGVKESALAVRHYERRGALDAYGFARLGEHTGPSLGAAGAWVATEALELHASARWLHGFDGWQAPSHTSPDTVARTDPWHITRQGAAQQWLLGAQWTGQQQHSLLIEAWRDTTAPSAAQWRAWQVRNAGLGTLATHGAPAAAVAGNLAWQADPTGNGGSLGPMNLQRNNLYARLAWQPEGWQFSLDALWQPADGGLLTTAALQWQGDRWRVDAAWRHFGGPSSALMRQLPLRTQGAVMLTRAF